MFDRPFGIYTALAVDLARFGDDAAHRESGSLLELLGSLVAACVSWNSA